jgi:hypothetical protein
VPTPSDPAPPGAVTPEEAAAVIAAVEQFLRDTVAPAVPPPVERVDAWTRRGLLEGVGREDTDPTPWGDPHPWG